ncbi:hypothetical protein CFB84_20080 [Burkholderia aenigmatica]|uniref:Uncharacterized protein n=2 Tax=Burkholderia aenigmatica TaxID=2015348 RepID=A0A228IN94_9BURK|nr:hypothetical protein CFB84_20080 [Burkholderia aenigmatica]
MLGGVTLTDGRREVQPFYEPPWLVEEAERPTGLLAHMRSEFPCLPFGTPWLSDAVVEEWRDAVAANANDGDSRIDESDDLLHGYGCIADWNLVRKNSLEVELALEYPETSSIRRVSRAIRAVPDRPAIDFQFVVEARERTRRPLGLHPMLKLPSLAGAMTINPGVFRFGVVHPGGPEPGVSRAMPGAFFSELGKVPLSDGQAVAFDCLPFEYDTEEIIQLCGTDGCVDIADESGVAYRLSWDASVLPSLLLWISNRGRQQGPWNGRNLCLGIEPIASAFELGCRASLSDNPINQRGVSTAVLIEPGNPVVINYRFEALKI